MDLVEIRKKAKQKKAATETAAEAAPVADLVVDEAPPVEVQVVEHVPPVSATIFDAVEADQATDALERLFRSQDELALATEESYLQALQGRTDDGAEARTRWLTFALGSEQYAVNIEYIKEIIKPREITEIPRVPAFLLGIISLRGVIIPIVDLRRRLHLGELEFDEHTRILVCEEQDRIAGLLVDSITQVVQLGDEEIEPPPAILSGLDRELVDGVGRIHGQMMILLNLPQVLDMEMH